MNKSLIGSHITLERPRVSPGFDIRPPIGITPAHGDAPGTEIIPAYAELFHSIDRLRVGGGAVVVSLSGVGRGTDAAPVAAALARTAAAVLESDILYLDATGTGIWAGPDLLRASREGFSPREASLPTREPLVRWAAIGRLLSLAADDTLRLFEAIRSDFLITVIDCGPIRGGTSAVPTASLCDGAILVTEAERTRASDVGVARAAIERAGGNLIGAVLNGGATRLPRWLEARL